MKGMDDHRFDSDRFAPSDAVILSILCVVSTAFGLSSATRQAAVLHAAITAGFMLAIGVIAIRPRARWSPWLRSFATVAVILTLYSTIAEPAFTLMSGSRDASLAAVDRALSAGIDVGPAVARNLPSGAVEPFAFIYGWFVPYLYLSIFLGCFGRPERERRMFLFGLSITYAVAYLGYLFVPARGPIEYYAFASTLEGGRFLELVRESVEATGGNHGAFPSLHVGATLYLTLFDLRFNRLRGMTYVPIVILIAASTIVLRYHYVVDLIVGAWIAWVALLIAVRWRARAEKELA